MVTVGARSCCHIFGNDLGCEELEMPGKNVMFFLGSELTTYRAELIIWWPETTTLL